MVSWSNEFERVINSLFTPHQRFLSLEAPILGTANQKFAQMKTEHAYVVLSLSSNHKE